MMNRMIFVFGAMFGADTTPEREEPRAAGTGIPVQRCSAGGRWQHGLKNCPEKMGGLTNTARGGRREEGGGEGRREEKREHTYTVKAMRARRVTIPHFKAMGHSSGLSTSPRGSKSKS